MVSNHSLADVSVWEETHRLVPSLVPSGSMVLWLLGSLVPLRSNQILSIAQTPRPNMVVPAVIPNEVYTETSTGCFTTFILKNPEQKQKKVLNLIKFSCLFQAIVFVVGGGNYIEYQNLVDYTKVLWY